MDAVKYFKERKRMLDSLGRISEICVGVVCENCPMSSKNNEFKCSCESLEIEYPEKAIEIIEKWSSEHPVRTMLMDFMEKHPKAPLEEDGAPNMCPYKLGYEAKDEIECDFFSDCIDCWNRPIKEGGEQK